MARRRPSWPFAHVPDHLDGTCSECGRATWVVPVVDYGTEAEPAELVGFVLLCWPCLGRDGDPLHHYR